MSKKIKVRLEVSMDGYLDVEVDHEEFQSWFEEGEERLAAIDAIDVIEFIQSGREWEKKLLSESVVPLGSLDIDGGTFIGFEDE